MEISDDDSAQLPLPPLPPLPNTLFNTPPLEEIPMPKSNSASGQGQPYSDMDLPAEIPLPASTDTSARYSPSRVLGAEDEDDMTSPTDRKKSVLGKAQAKKRLLAFSAAKAAAAGSPTSSHTTTPKKNTPLKPVSIKHKPEPVLAIQTIKEEETQMKKMIAMNSLLADKLNQVKLIATTVPNLPNSLPDIPIVTPPLPLPSLPTTKEKEVMTASLPQTAVVKPLAVSEPTVDSSSRKRSLKKPKRHDSTHSSSRSRSPAAPRSPDGRADKKRNKRSKSRSRSKDRDHRSKKLRRSRSRSRSPAKVERRRGSRERRRDVSPPRRDRDRAERDRGRRRRSRSRSRSENRPAKRNVSPRPEKAERNPEFARTRRTRMPLHWEEYKRCEYSISDINTLWLHNKDEKDIGKSRSDHSAESSKRVSSVLEESQKLSNTLGMPTKSTRLVLSSGLVGNYPTHLIHFTKVSPKVQFGYNRLSIKGYYKQREDIYKEESPEILQEMDVIINASTPSRSQAEKQRRSRDNRGWFTSSEQSWFNQGPTATPKGVVISHLYSEDEEESKSPFPVMKDEVMEQETSQINKGQTSDEVEGSDVEDEMSVDSMPSPLLKQRYQEVDEPPSPLLQKAVEPPSKRTVFSPSEKSESSSEQEVEVKVCEKKVKKKKMKRKNKRTKSSSSDDDDEEERKRRRKKREKKRGRRKEKESSSDEEERKVKAKKKRSKKKRDDRSPSSEPPPPPPPKGGSGASGKTPKSGESKSKDKSKKSDMSRSREGSGKHKDKDRHRHGGRRKDFLIDPNEFDEDLTLTPFSESGGVDLDEIKEDLETAAQLDPEAQKIMSSFETDEFFQLFFHDPAVQNGNEVKLEAENVEIVKEEPFLAEPKPPEEISSPLSSVATLEEATLKVKPERTEPSMSERPRQNEKRDDERPRRRHRSRSRSRSRTPDHYYHSNNRIIRNFSYRRRSRRYGSRSDSDECERDRYYHYRHRYHRHHHSYRKRDESPRDRIKREVKPSPPLPPDSTISDAELAQQPIKTSPVGSIQEDTPGQQLSQDVDDCGYPKRSVGYQSPPRRLSLDERLEMEMGIKLTEDVPKPVIPVSPSSVNGKGYMGPVPSFYLNNPRGIMIPLPPNLGEPFRGPPPPGSQWGHPVPMGMVNLWTRPRQQSQVIQIGDTLRVLPAEIPPNPFTVTCATPFGDRSNHTLNGQLKQEEKRVVRIKVPVVPFTVPVAQPIVPPPLTEEEKSLRRKKRRAEKLKKLEREKAKKMKMMEKEKAKAHDTEVEDEVSPEELALLKEAISESFDEDTPQKEEEDGEDVLVESESALDKVEPIEPQLKADSVGVEDEVEKGIEPEPTEAQIVSEPLPVAVENVKVEENEVPWGSQPVKILPAPETGILVPFGLRERTGGKKAVKFVDGIHPGYGSADEAGEGMCSPPPPPASYPYKTSVIKDKGTKKKKIKVKILREKKIELELPSEPTEPPPPPPTEYPFCPIGILYQVCPRYAVLYAETIAEKGYDIVFEPTTQQPYGEDKPAGTVYENDPEVKLFASVLPLGQEGWLPPDTQHPTIAPYGSAGWGALHATPSTVSCASQDQSGWGPVKPSVSKIPTILTSKRNDLLRNALDFDEFEVPRSPIATEVSPLPANPNLLVVSPSKKGVNPLPQKNPNLVVISPTTKLNTTVTTTTPQPIPVPPELPRIKKKRTWDRVGASISIPLSKIAAANSRLKGGQTGSDNLYQNYNYDFTPATDSCPVKGQIDLDHISASKFKLSRNTNNILIIPTTSTPPGILSPAPS